MVASQIARRARAVAAAALILLSALPFTPVAQATAHEGVPDTSFNFHIEQGWVMIKKGGKGTSFVEPGDTVTVNVTTSSKGREATVPVYVYIEGFTPLLRCFKQTYQDSTLSPDVRTAEVNFVVPPGLSPGGHKVVATVNRGPPAGYASPPEDCGSPDPSNLRDQNPDDNKADAYFVNDRRVDYHVANVRWCEGEPKHTLTGCGNVAAPATAESASPTYFVVEVVNKGTWTDLTNHTRAECGAAPCRDFNYSVRVTVEGPGLAQPLVLTPDHAYRTANGTSGGGPGHWWNVGPFDLAGRAGAYAVKAELFNTDENATALAAGKEFSREVFVHYADYAASFGDEWRTSPEAPYPFEPNSRIAGNVTVRNLGWRNVTHNVNWTAYIDRPGTLFSRNGGNFSATADDERITGMSEWRVPLEWYFSTDPTTKEYLAPGIHKLHFVIDHGKNTTETDEANNAIVLDIYIADDKAPVFLNTPKITGTSAYSDWDDKKPIRPHDPFRLAVNASDDDAGLLTVVANFSAATDPSVYRTYPIGHISGNTYADHIKDLPFHGNGTTSKWTLVVEARDPFGNVANTSPQTVTLEPWPLHTATADEIVVSPPDGKKFCWQGDDCGEPGGADGTTDIGFEIFVRSQTTGISDQNTNASNLYLEAQPPQGKPNQTRPPETWTPVPCPLVTSPPPNATEDPQGALEGSSTTRDCNARTRTWKVPVDKEAGAPGVWNVTIRISDVSGMTRWINRTFELIDLAPEIGNQTIGNATLNASETLSTSVNVRDDAGVAGAFVNFTRADGLSTNLTMRLGDVDRTGERLATLNVTTGRGRMLGNAGDYQVTFHVVDSNGNWNSTKPSLPFKLHDLTVPNLVTAGVQPPLQEVGSNVTFFARVLDDSNVSVKLSVLRPGSTDAIVGPVEMVEGPDGNYTHVASFDREGDYEWVIRVRDSAGKDAEDATGSLQVRLNLGPRFDVRSPPTVIDGKRYGQGAPRIEVFAYDNDGLDEATLTFLVDGQVVSPDVVPGPAGSNGYVVSYQVPQSKRYVHGATVTVNLSAVDNSTARLTGYSNFTFQVDDVAPVAKAIGFEPSHRAASTDFHNVSLETRFTLGATDDDGLPTDVSNIRYTVARRTGANQISAQIVYSGPFRLSEVPGITVLPGLYQISFFAEDAVGNRNSDLQTLTVWLDASPPYLDPYGRLPDGREVTVTILDDGAGTDRAVVWHSVNNGTYAFTAMVQQGNAWKADLPESRKGDRIAYYVQAWDLVGNTARFGTPEEPLGTFLVPNHKPTLNVTSPAQGDVLSRTRDVTWEAADVDGDDLVATISIKAPGAPQFSELARIETPGRRSYSLDTTRLGGDGDYTLRVNVHDGTAGEQMDVVFSVRNSASAISTVAAGSARVLPGEATLLTAQITKAEVVAVEARVYEGDRLVDAFPMRDDGEEGDVKARDGIWSVLVKLDAAGDYRVDVVATYRESGKQEVATSPGAAFFSVANTPGYILQQHSMLIALVAFAAAVAMGVAGFVAFRRRR